MSSRTPAARRSTPQTRPRSAGRASARLRRPQKGWPPPFSTTGRGISGGRDRTPEKYGNDPTISRASYPPVTPCACSATADGDSAASLQTGGPGSTPCSLVPVTCTRDEWGTAQPLFAWPRGPNFWQRATTRILSMDWSISEAMLFTLNMLGHDHPLDSHIRCASRKSGANGPLSLRANQYSVAVDIGEVIGCHSKPGRSVAAAPDRLQGLIGRMKVLWPL
jgi:hypothetical protein